jgi:hypothetical protein
MDVKESVVQKIRQILTTQGAWLRHWGKAATPLLLASDSSL